MSLSAFCNRCFTTKRKALLVTNCRHVVCSDCFAKSRRKCAYCRASCKALRLDELPEEMSAYFSPYMPQLKKIMKIAKFQLQQRSLWTEKHIHILQRARRVKERIAQKKKKLAELKRATKKAVERNKELKSILKKARRKEPENPFEMNSNRIGGRRASYPPLIQPKATGPVVSFDSSSRSSSSRSTRSSVNSPPMHGGQSNHMSSTVNSASFFNGSSISASSSIHSNSTNSSGRTTDHIRSLLQNSSIQTPPCKITKRRNSVFY